MTDFPRYPVVIPISYFANGNTIGNIQKYLETCDQSFQTSQLHSPSSKCKFTDEDLHKSSFRAITDPKLFDLVDQVVCNLNDISNDKSYHYILQRNDITHIVYKRGSFFKRQYDFASQSNVLEEFTLLLCVTPPNLLNPLTCQHSDNNNIDNMKDKSICQGGNTIIHTWHDGPKTFDTTTPGCGILFRKDLDCEGMELQCDEKHIIAANIWATKVETRVEPLRKGHLLKPHGGKRAQKQIRYNERKRNKKRAEKEGKLNHSKPKKKRVKCNKVRDERRKEAQNKRKYDWHNPMIKAFGVRVQNYQGMFLSRGGETGEAPDLGHFRRWLQNGPSFYNSIGIDRRVSRRSPSCDAPVTVPGRDFIDGK